MAYIFGNYFSIDNYILVQPSASGKKDVILNGNAEASAVGVVAETGPIDEDLFDDEDLDELEEDLENLEV